MNRRWSADSSTNDTTADSPTRLAGQRREPRVVEPHRDVGREVLEQVAGQPELGEHDQARPAGPRLREQLAVARQVRLEVAEAWRELREGDPQGVHGPSIASRAGATERPARSGRYGGVTVRRAACGASAPEIAGVGA